MHKYKIKKKEKKRQNLNPINEKRASELETNWGKTWILQISMAESMWSSELEPNQLDLIVLSLLHLKGYEIAQIYQINFPWMDSQVVFKETKRKKRRETRIEKKACTVLEEGQFTNAMNCFIFLKHKLIF